MERSFKLSSVLAFNHQEAANWPIAVVLYGNDSLPEVSSPTDLNAAPIANEVDDRRIGRQEPEASLHFTIVEPEDVPINEAVLWRPPNNIQRLSPCVGHFGSLAASSVAASRRATSAARRAMRSSGTS
jgi:hypothetical protein